MNRITAQVRLQYRPSADILSGRADFDHPDLVDAVDGDTEPIDSDTMVSWSVPRRGEFSDQLILRSFSIIGAKKRFSARHRPDFVPSSLWTTALTLLDTSIPRGTPVAAAALAKAEARHSIDVDDLVRVSQPGRTGDADVGVARSLASASRRLSRSIDYAMGSGGHADPDPESPPRRFVRDLDMMASVVAAHRRPVPSVVNDLLSNLRGGLPLTQSERARVRRALRASLEVDQWRDVASDLLSLSEAMTSPSDTPDDDVPDNE
ncbi:MAG: hypothetical protein ACKODY_05685 [Actinomycetota bacterium]